MIDVDEYRNMILTANHLPNVDGRYTFYYDETNNVRKLHLTGGGMNIRRPESFVLGGIVHRGRPNAIDLTPLRASLRLQPNAKEIKLKHLGQGDFLQLLKSAKVEAFLKWVTEQGFLVHYQVTDLLYWSIVDIVDSILAEAREPQLYMAHMLLKDGLYSVLRDDVDGTAEFLGRYGYPDVGRQRRPAFVAELLELVENREDMLDHFAFYMLKGLLQMARKLTSLPYLEDETPNVLIEGFGEFFRNRLCLFKNSQHILDDEKVIEAYLEALPFTEKGAPLRHFRFANSQSEPGIQISDPLAGLLGKLFSHINRTPLGDLEAELEALSPQQRRSLALLARLLDASTDECPGFAQHIIADEDRRRASFLLEGDILRYRI